MPVIGAHTFNLRDFVKETTQTAGTGAYQLDGVANPNDAGHQSFLTAVGDGQKTLYAVQRGSTWEKGIGTVSAGAPVSLSRDLILGTSADDSQGADPIDWPSTDPKDIHIGSPADLLNLILDPARVVALEGRITELNGQLTAFAGNKMLFVQSAAPTGWVQDTSQTDRVLRIVDDGTGGATGGAWAFSGGTAEGHSLSVAEMAAHGHGLKTTDTSGGNSNVLGGDAGGDFVDFRSGSGGTVNTFGDVISDTGSGNPHEHTVVGDGTWRPAYQNAIVCTVDDWLQPAP